MPYFKTPAVNLLYLHVPKTGGMSVEKYFYETLGVPRNYASLHGYFHPSISFREVFGNDQEHTLQHLTYRQIAGHSRELGVDMSGADVPLTVLATVRNPYHRIISDMFFFVVHTGITVRSTKTDIEDAIRAYLTNPHYEYDNHRLPQYEFIRDCEGFIPRNAVILRLETLAEDMREIGFADFDAHENRNRTGKRETDYIDLFTDEAIRTINKYYHDDFLHFGYTKIEV
jgi:hypothetical protein